MKRGGIEHKEMADKMEAKAEKTSSYSVADAGQMTWAKSTQEDLPLPGLDFLGSGMHTSHQQLCIHMQDEA